MGAGKLEPWKEGIVRKKNITANTELNKFDTVIIDEVSKATPPELFIPISWGKRLILVGDFKQLPPMFKILSGDDKTQEEWAKEANIDPGELDTDDTIFERLWKRHEGDSSPIKAMLTEQYRMHSHIQSIIEPFYTDSEGKLSCGLDETQIEKLEFKNNALLKPTVWIGTKSIVNGGEEKKKGTSFINRDEIEKVGKILEKISTIVDKQTSIGVITFYGAQLRELRNHYQYKYGGFGDGKLVFGTVDRFQGRECDIIICSLVRNNNSRHIGFAKKPNRINVAFSRAKRCLIILGSREQFCYEGKNKEAIKLYKDIYDKCYHPKPKELE